MLMTLPDIGSRSGEGELNNISHVYEMCCTICQIMSSGAASTCGSDLSPSAFIEVYSWKALSAVPTAAQTAETGARGSQCHVRNECTCRTSVAASQASRSSHLPHRPPQQVYIIWEIDQVITSYQVGVQDGVQLAACGLKHVCCMQCLRQVLRPDTDTDEHVVCARISVLAWQHLHAQDSS